MLNNIFKVFQNIHWKQENSGCKDIKTFLSTHIVILQVSLIWGLSRAVWLVFFIKSSLYNLPAWACLTGEKRTLTQENEHQFTGTFLALFTSILHLSHQSKEVIGWGMKNSFGQSHIARWHAYKETWMYWSHYCNNISQTTKYFLQANE